MVGFDEEFILQVVGGEIVIALANPVVQDLEIRFETGQKTLF